MIVEMPANGVPLGACVWEDGRRAGSDDRGLSGLRVGEGVGDDGGDGPTESCGPTRKFAGIAGRASLRGVRGGGRDCLERLDGLGTISSATAGTESHHISQNWITGTSTFAECRPVFIKVVENSTTESRESGSVFLPSEFRGACRKEFLRGLSF